MAEISPRFFQASTEPFARRWLSRLDWSLVAAALGLAMIGLLFVYSATVAGGAGGSFLARQGGALALGVAGMVVLAVMPYQVFQTYAKPVFIVSLVLLAAVLFFGTKMRGSRSWFHMGPVHFQPVELTRLALAVALAAYADARARDMGDWRTLAAPLAMTASHAVLILLQPDLSSALSLGPMTMAVLYTAGAPLWALVSLAGLVAISLGIPLTSTYFAIIKASPGAGWAAAFFRRAFTERGAFFQLWAGVAAAVVAGWWFLRRWRVAVSGAALFLTLGVIAGGVAGSFVLEKAIKDYQRKRLIAFVDPAVDPLKAGYNILQSKITLGSGKFLGKGYLSGSQSQLGFLPEKHTDFIFSLIGEELGFVGSLFILAAYFWIVFRAYDIAATARDRFGRCLATGIGTYFAFTGLVNMGMTMGLMPVTGLPLPFLSYGGSGLVGSFLAAGLLLSVHLRRYIL